MTVAAAGRSALNRLRSFATLARPAQWIKNGFVLLPLFFAHALGDPSAVRGALLATLAFCLASSAVYAGNDVADVERDRLHPGKRGRPVAAGDIAPHAALAFGAGAAVIALGIAFVGGGVPLGLAIAAYFALQAAYTLLLKRIAWIDVAVVATGFVLRLVAGGIGAGVPLTPWIVVMGFLLALMLALGKRHGDLSRTFDPAARAASGYSARTLGWVLALLGGATFAAYVLYTLSPAVLARHGQRPLIESTPWVALGIVRYLVRVLRDAGIGSNPTRLALTDPVLLVAVIGWLAGLLVILYR